MRRISTFSILFALLLISFSAFSQCGGIQYNFNTGSTDGFTGTGTTFGNSGTALRFSNITSGTLSLTTPTFTLPSNATTIDFGFTYSTGGPVALNGVNVLVKYVNTSGNVSYTNPVAISPFTSPICTSIPKPSDMISTGPTANSFQLIFTFAVSGGNGANGSNLTIDDYRTTSTAAAIILPVKFSSFDAKSSSNSNSLTWNVSSEENVVGYDVERSSDGRNFSKIAFVNATGDKSYNYVDSRGGSTAYYRIKSVDVSGKYGYSTVALLKGGRASIVLKAFPMPALKEITIQHATATDKSIITISSEDGRMIKSVTPSIGTQQTVVDLSSAKAGLYLIRYNNGNGEVETLKILKQ